jgi:hypothetical protein
MCNSSHSPFLLLGHKVSCEELYLIESVLIYVCAQTAVLTTFTTYSSVVLSTSSSSGKITIHLPHCSFVSTNQLDWN